MLLDLFVVRCVRCVLGDVRVVRVVPWSLFVVWCWSLIACCLKVIGV